MGAIMLNGAKIGKNSLVGAGSVVTEGKGFPDNSLIVGAPARCNPHAGRKSRVDDPRRRRHLCAPLEAIRNRTDTDRLIVKPASKRLYAGHIAKARLSAPSSIEDLSQA